MQPGFRLKGTESRLLNVAVIPWQVLGGTLRSLGPSLDRAFDLCRAHFWKLVAILGIPWMATGLVVAIGFAAIKIGGLAWDTLSNLPIWLPVMAVVTLVPALLMGGLVLIFLPHAASIYAISMLHMGEQIYIGQAYRYAWAKLGRLILTELLLLLVIVGLVVSSGIAAAMVALPLTGLAQLSSSLRSPWVVVAVTVLAFCVFLFPLAYCIPKLLFIDIVVMIEDMSGAKALKRSWALLSGRSGRAWYTSYYWILGMLLLISIPIHWAVRILFEGPGWLLGFFLTDLKVFSTYATQLLSHVGSFFAQLFVSVSMVVFYYSVRNRREGLDLLLLTREGEPASTENG